MTTLDTQHIEQALRGTMFAGKLHHFQTIDSTQNQALHDAQLGAESGQVYIADEQTAGRGRGGHNWHSEPNDGLYLTVLVRPALQGADALMISLATGLAVKAAIQTVSGFSIDLRWPNDLVTQGAGSRKLGGILTESAITPDGVLRHAAIGIGINLNQQSMPDSIADISTSIRIAAGHDTKREDLTTALLRNLAEELIALEAGPGDVLQRFASASSWVNGKRVRVAEDDGYTGVTAGLTSTGLLRVRCDDGSTRTVRHGGVREG